MSSGEVSQLARRIQIGISSSIRTGYEAGQRTIVHLDGLGAYVIGVLLIGLGIFGGFRTFRR